jgi:hypothetical protein
MASVPFVNAESRTDEMHLSSPTGRGHFPHLPHVNSLQGGIYTSKMAVTPSSYFLLAARLHTDLSQA